ncbi:MAG: T9SS type A sorting domain-containing protein [bacterium]
MYKYLRALSLFLIISSPLIAIQRHVYESNGAQGIQDSINVSSTYDTVMVHKGIYYVRDIDSLGITMKDSIILFSPNPDSVTLNGLNSTGTDTAYHVIYCDFGNSDSSGALIKGFKITGGNASGDGHPNGFGGGICCLNSSPVIESCIITDNYAKSGGGIYSYCGSPIIVKNSIANNSCSQCGGGMRLLYGTPIVVENSIINNYSNWLGGGIFSDYSASTILRNTINHNSAHWDGGGVWLNAGNIILRDNIIINDSARDYGGGIYLERANVTIEENTIVNNHAKFGGGIYSCGFPKIKYNIIIDTTFCAIYIKTDSAFIDSNNIYATGYAVSNSDSFDIDARYNYWGTVDTNTINAKIYDFYDNSTMGIVCYQPFLTDSLKFGIEEKKIENIKTNLSIYPNPSFGNSIIKYGLPEKATVSLTLYDISGRLVQTMYSGTQKAGDHTININSYKIAKGIYFAKLNAGDFKATKKLILMR